MIGYISDFKAEGLKLSSTGPGSTVPSDAVWYQKYGDPIPMLKETSNEEIFQNFKEGVWENDTVSLFKVRFKLSIDILL